jgi:tRNA-modifying protein YgfZ
MTPLYYAETPRDVLALTGRDRASFLQGMVTNDVLSLTPGQSCYAFHLDATGHVLADMYVLCQEERLLLVTEPGMGETLAALLDGYLVMERVKIAPLTGYRHYLVLGFFADGVLYTHYEDALGQGLLTDGPIEIPGKAVDEAFLEAMRIGAGIPRFGVDMDKRVLAPETGELTRLRAIHYKKGCYVGQEIVARIDARGHTNRTLISLRLPAPVEANTPITWEGKEVGRITSSAPALQGAGAVALGYLRHEHATPGTILDNATVAEP